jgi:uncharacterized protein
MRTTVAIHTPTRDRLLELKRAWGLKSLEEVIDRLANGAPLGAKALYLARKKQVDHVLAEHGIEKLVAFGSRARGDARPDSDLDLVATVPEATSLFDLVHIKDDLEDAFGVPVNLLTPGGLRKRLRQHVEEEGVILAART